MAISIEQIKQLREETGAGVLDCRKALETNSGDFQKAVEYSARKAWRRLPNGQTGKYLKVCSSCTRMVMDAWA